MITYRISQEPYKAIREEFRKFMEAADVCIVVGFSFRDEHLNTIFSDFYKLGKSAIVVRQVLRVVLLQ